ncbi:hypothetical protein As57867_015567, partial [Aphanomyces stellatus]
MFPALDTLLLTLAPSWSPPFVVFLVVLVLGLALVYFVVLEPAWNPLHAMPGPPSSHWFYGSLRDIIITKWADGSFPNPHLAWVQKYGGAVHYRIAFNHQVLLTDPDALKHVFNTHNETYPRAHVARELLRDMLGGDGLLSTEANVHAHQRKMLMPHFGHGKIKDFVHVFTTHAHQLQTTHLNAVADTTTPIDLHDCTLLTSTVTCENWLFVVFTKLTLDVIGMAAFSFDCGSLAGVNNHVVDAYKRLTKRHGAANFVAILYIPGYQKWPLPWLNEKRAAKHTLFAAVDDVIAAKLRAPRDPSRPVDLLDLMLDDHVGHHVTPEEARTHVMTFMLAGHETTSTTLSWVFALLAQHPDIEAKARDEARAVVAGGGIGWSTVAELKYITACIQETLRLFPTIAQAAMRVCTQDDLLPMSTGKPYAIPKGTSVVVNTGALHRNPKYWSRPHDFVPERFLDGSVEFAADKALRNG